VRVVTAPASVRTGPAATRRPVRAWVEQDAGALPRIARECGYAGATVAALVAGMPVRRRGDLLHVRVDGRWHALAVVPAGQGAPGPVRGPAGSRWVHFDLDLHDWFSFGTTACRSVPASSGWRAVRWLAGTAAC